MGHRNVAVRLFKKTLAVADFCLSVKGKVATTQGGVALTCADIIRVDEFCRSSAVLSHIARALASLVVPLTSAWANLAAIKWAACRLTFRSASALNLIVCVTSRAGLVSQANA